MRRLKLYLETSVWNFYFADDAPEKKETTVRFFHEIKKGTYEIFISDTVLEEIGNASEDEKRLLFNLIKQYQPKNIPIIPEMLNLSYKYLSENALPGKANKDAIHAAVATVSEMDALISWNLKHLANLRRMEKINGINLKEGFTKRLELITPMEVSYE
ncbi:MAG: type II toxin-antitoxin system VapC family toxin [Desulfobacteraceae bacterium]|nr:type II toxin-antitoxin system VapC family toxin [Desulfobacteraceae bacterium]